MKKSKFKAIPLKEMQKERNSHKYTVTAELAKVDKDTILITNVYLTNSSLPTYRIFLSKEDYITEKIDKQERTWLTGFLDYYTEHYYYWDSNSNKKKNDNWFVDNESLLLCKEFLSSSKEHIFDIILNFQQGIKEKKKEAKRRKYTDPIDKKMESIKELPEEFHNWIQDNVLHKSRYVYYKYSKEKYMQGYCTHCQKEVSVSGAKHNESGICPSCETQITYKALGKSKHVKDCEKAAFVQATDSSGFVIRYFDVIKEYGKDYKNPNFYLHENKRVFYTSSLEMDSYVYSYYANICTRWIYEADERVGGYSAYYGYSTWRDSRTFAALYSDNIKEIFIETGLKYSDIWKLARCNKNFRFDIEGFIENIRNGNHCAEKLIKCDLFNLARDTTYKKGVGLNEKESTLNKILGVENDDAKIIIKSNADYMALNLFKEVRKNGKRLTVDQLIEIMKCDYSCDVLKQLFKYTSPSKVLKYLSGQKCKDKDVIYRDYLDMCVKLKFNVKSSFVLFPKKVKSAHDINVELINEKSNRETYKQHNSKYSAIKKISKSLETMFGYENEQFLIRPPVDAAEIVIEGQKLHHCVGGGYYSQRMAKGEIAILFLRDKKKLHEPYYTIEINMKNFNISQCHGFKNKDKDKKLIDDFIKKWKKDILKNLAQSKQQKAG